MHVVQIYTEKHSQSYSHLLLFSNRQVRIHPPQIVIKYKPHKNELWKQENSITPSKRLIRTAENNTCAATKKNTFTTKKESVSYAAYRRIHTFTATSHYLHTSRTLRTESLEIINNTKSFLDPSCKFGVIFSLLFGVGMK
jgi:hypothetical protein